MLRLCVLLAGFFAGAVAMQPAAFAVEVGIEWKAENRYRLLVGDEEVRYKEDLERVLNPAIHGRGQYPDPMGLRVPYSTYWDEKTFRYTSNYLSPGGPRRVTLSPVLLPQLKKSRPLCVWTVAGVEQLHDPECQDRTVELSEGVPVEVVLRVHHAGNVYFAQRSIHLRDLIVVALGDSFGAGEGVPLFNARIPNGSGVGDGYPAINEDAVWQDRRCHRSLFSGFNQALFALAQSLPERHVTVFDFTCSGARVLSSSGDSKGGLLTGYDGAEHERRRSPLSPQVAEAGRALCADGAYSWDVDRLVGHCSRSHLPDDAEVLTLISVGGNDIGFADVVRDFAARRNSRKIEEVVREAEEKIQALPERYRQLDAAIRGSWRSQKILITEYPDPTHDEHGNFAEAGPICRAKALNRWVLDWNFTITKGEHKIAYERLLVPLNRTVKNSANELGWTYVGGLMEATARRGICAKPSNFSWIGATLNRTDTFSGAYHPNIFGYLRYKEVLLPRLRAAVNRGGADATHETGK